METKQTLTSMFEANKQVLEESLKDLYLPKDVKKIQSITEEFFNVFIQNKYRQNLSKSEDYILQAALSLLDAQQKMGQLLTEQEITIDVNNLQIEIGEKNDVNSQPESFIQNMLSQKLDVTKTLIGVGSGAILGKVTLDNVGKVALDSGWGAVFGAIAGTAIVLYLATKSNNKNSKTKTIVSNPNVETTIQNKKIDVTMFLAFVQQTCESIDDLIFTFQTQIQKVINKYESQEKPTLEKEYGLLLESIQSLLGTAYKNLPDEKRLAKIDDYIEMLVESLANYGLEIIRFNGDNIALFEQIESTKILDAPVMVYPAICKNGVLIKRGKVFC